LGTFTVVTENTSTNNLCTMVYVYDKFDEMQECCGCPLTPGTSRVDPLRDFTDNPNFEGGFSSIPFGGTVIIYAAEPNNRDSVSANGGCDPSTAFTASSGLGAWLVNESVLFPNPPGHFSRFSAFTSNSVNRTFKDKNVLACGFNAPGGDGVCGCGTVHRSLIVPTR
jgi:hypothetical protein